MKYLVATLAFIGVALSAIASASASTYPYKRTIDLTVQPAGANTLDVRALNGDVKLIADSGTKVRVHAMLYARDQDTLAGTSVRAVRDKDTVHIDNLCATEHHILFWTISGCDVDYEIRYPRSLIVNVQDDNGDVTVQDAVTNVAAATKHGDVKAILSPAWQGNTIVLATKTGDVHLQVPHNFAGTLQAHTRLGDVKNNAHLNGGNVNVTATTTLGDVNITRMP